MALGPQAYGIIAMAVVAGCGEAPGPTSMAPAVAAERHPDKRLFVRYGADEFFVDIRYVDMIQESVIAVRESGGKMAGRETITVPATVGIPTGQPFSSSAFEPLVVSIAQEVNATEAICADGRKMTMRTKSDGDVRASFRSGRDAWVVFAACPAPVTG
ncbi:MAG: hypothetical protein AAF503_11845 [Pseudomonadota bacterium]